MDVWTDIQPDVRKFTPLSYRTSSPSGPLPKKEEKERAARKKGQGKERMRNVNENAIKKQRDVSEPTNQEYLDLELPKQVGQVAQWERVDNCIYVILDAFASLDGVSEVNLRLRWCQKT